MSDTTGERLYTLLPAVYRVRDVAQGEPLRALLGVLEDGLELLEGDIDRLYDNWFIETCDEWVVPYLGDLLGVRGLLPVQNGALSQRALVANTLAYRRAKGTAAMLEQLARDVTGWPTKAVEFFELLATTQYLNHVRLVKGGTVDLRDTNQLELINGPFQRVAHTAEVRHIDNGRGKYNIPNIALFLWRLQSYAVTRGTAHPVTEPADGRYRLSPLGHDIPLFNRPRTEKEISQLAAEENVPGPLRRRPLYDELEANRQALVNSKTPRNLYFGDQPVLQVFVDGALVPSARVAICDLSNPPSAIPEGWRRPAATKRYTSTSGGPPEDLPIQVAVDPILGRLAFPAGVTPTQVEVSYAYGFPGDLGGGPYDRRQTLADPSLATWNKTVAKQDPGADFNSLGAALAAWADPNNGNKANAIITIVDSATYAESLSIKPANDRGLVIQAANGNCPTLRFVDVQRHVAELTVTGSSTTASLTLDGLLIEGGIHIEQESLGQLRIVHCTLVPGRSLDEEGQPQEPDRPSVTVEATNDHLKLEIDHSIVGPLRLPIEVAGLDVQDSIIDSPVRSGQAIIIPAIAASNAGERPGPPTTLKRTTVFGAVHVKELTLASEVIFTDLVVADRRQAGCVRFSYVPDGSRTPSRYRSQPDLAVQKELDAARNANPSITSAEQDRIKSDIRLRVTPSFTSVRYGDPGYAQLDLTCAEEIRTGAEDENEMGAFHFLQQAQRIKNLRASLDEYLRFGLEAGSFFVT